MDYIATLIFVVAVVIGGWFYGCEVRDWCGTGVQEGIALNEALERAQSDNATEKKEEKDMPQADTQKTKMEDDKKSAEQETETKNSEESDGEKKECTQEYLTKDIRPGRKNDKQEVIKLEKFLNDFEGEKLITGGVYDGTDQAAVKRFQEKYRKDILDPAGVKNPNGLVLEGTRKKINELYCTKNKEDK